MTKKYFGTDGIRGKLGESVITPEFALKLGYAAGRTFKENLDNTMRRRVLIGKDTRISGYLLESALEAGFAAAGVDVALLGPVPTPAIAYLTRTFHACAGVVVSASHNPYYDNGIKFFSARGRKLDDALEAQIEAYLNEYIDKDMQVTSADELGKAKRINDAQGRYIEHCKSTVSPRFNLSGLHIVLDCANGATYQVAPKVFLELGAKVTVIANEPDGFNINENCGSTAPQALIDKVLATGADLGIAFDGDGDRVTMIDQRGKIIDGDAILYLIAQGLIHQGQKPAGVVGTVMTNMGTINAIQSLGIEFQAAAVGDRYVMEKLVKNQWSLGGESSGHIICLEKSTTGDGIVAALQVLETLVNSGTSLTQLLANYELYPMKMVNVDVIDKTAIMQNNQLLAAIDETNKALGNTGRLLIRASGTEPKVRVMAEATEQQVVDSLVERFVNQVKTIGVQE